MGTITLSKANRLFWLGRYLERVYTSLKASRPLFEADTDGQEENYAGYCEKLGLPNDYQSTANFIRRYYFDSDNPYSIVTALGHAYDNAVVLRETLTTETLAYIQMAVSAMQLAASSTGPGVGLQWVLDDIMAFRGSCEEKIDEEVSRNIIKTGASLERVDLYLRLGYDSALCEREFSRLFNRLYKAQLNTDQTKLNFLVDAILDKTTEMPFRSDLLKAVDGLFFEM